jgi:hypothetical protein
MGKEYLLFERTFNIFKNLLKYDLSNFIRNIEKTPIYLEKTKINNFKFNKETINNLVSYQ